MKKTLTFLVLFLTYLGFTAELLSQEKWTFTNTNLLVITETKLFNDVSMTKNHFGYVGTHTDGTNSFANVNGQVITAPLGTDVSGAIETPTLISLNDDIVTIGGRVNIANNTVFQYKITQRDVSNLGTVIDSVYFVDTHEASTLLRDAKGINNEIFILINGINNDTEVRLTHNGPSIGSIDGTDRRNVLVIFDKTTKELKPEQVFFSDEEKSLTKESITVSQNDGYVYISTYKESINEFTVYQYDSGINFVKSWSMIISSEDHNSEKKVPMQIEIDSQGNELLFFMVGGKGIRLLTSNMEPKKEYFQSANSSDLINENMEITEVQYINNAFIPISVHQNHDQTKGGLIHRVEELDGLRSVAYTDWITDASGTVKKGKPLWLSSTVREGKLVLIGRIYGFADELYLNGHKITSGEQSVSQSVFFETTIDVSSSKPSGQGFVSMSTNQESTTVIDDKNRVTHYGLSDLSEVFVNRIREEGSASDFPGAGNLNFQEGELRNSGTLNSLDSNQFTTMVGYFEKGTTQTLSLDLDLSKKESFTFFPSPNATGDLFFSNNLTGADILIIDYLGREVASYKNIQEFIDISSLTEGTYVVRIEKDNKTGIKKIIKI